VREREAYNRHDMGDPKDPTVATETAAEDAPTEETALDRARAYIAELEAQARLHDELAEAPAEGATTVQPPREEADAQALDEFQRLRERSTKKSL
jgi:hypothetical protein